MPLHLLGKKSWNVYNHANIDRVRRDEADAAAAQEAADQRMQDEDAARRTAILRGETPPPLTNVEAAGPSVGTKRKGEENGVGHASGLRRPRKKRHEDDTDMEMRLAKVAMAAAGAARERPSSPSRHTSKSEPDKSDGSLELVDDRGHISLFPAPVNESRAVRKSQALDQSKDRQTLAREKTERRERQKADRDRQTEQDAGKGMKFSDAAGRGRSNADTAWYVTPSTARQEEEVRKDAFGNEDPDRKGRDQIRMSSIDPMATMVSAQMKLKAVQKERQDWARTRKRELDSLMEEGRERAGENLGRREKGEGRRREGDRGKHREGHRNRAADRHGEDGAGGEHHRRCRSGSRDRAGRNDRNDSGRRDGHDGHDGYDTGRKSFRGHDGHDGYDTGRKSYRGHDGHDGRDGHDGHVSARKDRHDS